MELTDILRSRKSLRETKVANKKPLSASRFTEKKSENMELLEKARMYWMNLSDPRERANRTFQYYIGNQWRETMQVRDKYGKESTVTEEEYIRGEGRIPFVQNIMQQIGKNVIGQLQLNPSQSIVKSRNREDQRISDMLSAALDEELDNCRVDMIDPRQMEAFINSGFLLASANWEYIAERDAAGIKVEPINYNKFCFNGITDIRGTGLNFICEIKDASLNEIISVFARSLEDEQVIRNEYANSITLSTVQTGAGLEKVNTNFDTPEDPSLCRLYAVWQKKGEWRMREHDYLKATLKVTKRTEAQIQAENNERLQYCLDNGIEPNPKLHLISYEKRYEEYWYYKYLTVSGACLMEGESPFKTQDHPYIVIASPLLNGRIWSFNETLIDSQRQINRLFSLQDAILGGSAKNLLVIPEEALNGEFTSSYEQIIEEHSRINGVIVVKTKNATPLPQSITGTSAAIGIRDIVNSYINLILQISGVSQSIQGQRAPSGTPSSLYAQEAQYSQINVKDIMATFGYYKQMRDEKVLNLIRQYKKDGYVYNGKKEIAYNSEEAKAIKGVSVKVVQATDTPMYRSLQDDKLSQFVNQGLLDLKSYAELSSEPFAEPLLDLLNKREQEMAAQQKQGENPQQELSPEMIQGLQGVQQQLQETDTRTPEQQDLVAKALGMAG